MNQNEATIHRFFTAYQNKEYTTMQNCYSEDAVYNNPIYGLNDTEHVKAMWEMICKTNKEESLHFENIELLDHEYATCDWSLVYYYTNRRINNKIKSYLRLENGLIIEHTDAFDLYKWTRMAFGLTGSLIGWSNFFQKRIQKSTRKKLSEFIISK